MNIEIIEIDIFTIDSIFPQYSSFLHSQNFVTFATFSVMSSIFIDFVFVFAMEFFQYLFYIQVEFRLILKETLAPERFI